jgi:hypothetical protein
MSHAKQMPGYDSNTYDLQVAIGFAIFAAAFSLWNTISRLLIRPDSRVLLGFQALTTIFLMASAFVSQY